LFGHFAPLTGGLEESPSDGQPIVAAPADASGGVGAGALSPQTAAPASVTSFKAAGDDDGDGEE
jgi:hypothetical protein